MAGKKRDLTKATMGITDGIPLQASDGGVEELRKDIQRLMDIEAVKQLKHAYFRCIDTANLGELATLFHPDVTVHFVGGNYEWQLQGRDEYLESIKKSFTQEAVAHHNGHQPEIQMLSETEATGIWYLTDHMWVLNFNFLAIGTAIYWDRYLKVDGRWVIKETRYERIYEINQEREKPPPFVVRHLETYGSPVEGSS